MNSSRKNDIYRLTPEKLDIQEITDWLRRLRGAPYVPYSHYDVSALVRMQAGGAHLYMAGVNVEYPEQRISTHGEEGAIAALVTVLGKGAAIDEVWVMGASSALQAPSDDPRADHGGSCCGNCRQRLSGFTAPDSLVHTVALNGGVTSMKMNALLPDSFSFRDFMDQTPDAQRGAALPDISLIESRLLREGRVLEVAEIAAWLSGLESWDYASGRGEAVVVGFEGARYCAGVRVEDAAFTGTSAIQGAFAASCARWGRQNATHIWFKGVADEHMRAVLCAGAAQTLPSFSADPDAVPIMFL